MHTRKIETGTEDGLFSKEPEQDGCAQSTPLLLVDEHVLRRAALVRVLEEWARREDFDAPVSAVGTDLAGVPETVCLVLLSIGEKPVGARDVLLTLEELGKRMPGTRVVVLSELSCAEEAAAALRAGACGFVAMGAEPTLLLRVLKFVLAGGTYFPPEALLLRASEGRQAPGRGSMGEGTEGATEVKGITARQLEVLRLVQRGLPNKEIARVLEMSEPTVKIHVRQIMRKLGAANRTQVALLAAASTPTERS
jgi:DNA-binding NarL/FixJ family response regulator